MNGQAINLLCHIEGHAFRLPGPTAHELLRIGQEAVNNAVKHARCRQIEIALAYAPDAVRLTVADDGCGFREEDIPPVARGRFGLSGMRERAAKLGGRLIVQSQPGAGTRIEVSVPAGGTSIRQ